jgi:hypothetical protein
MSDAISTAVKSPCSFFKVLWSLSDDYFEASWPSFENNSFNGFLTNRLGATKNNNVSMSEAMLADVLAVWPFEGENKVTKQCTIRPSFHPN